MSHIINHIINTYGYLGLFLLAALEVACIPISSEVVLLGTGLLAATSHMHLAIAIPIAFAGELIGGYIGYAIGLTGGRKLIEKYGKYVLINTKDLEVVEKWFSHKRPWSVLIGRILPFLRNFVSLPAGTAKMGALRFGIYSSIGSLIWIVALTVVGYQVGSHFRSTIDSILSNVGYVIGILAVILAIGFIFHRYMRSKRSPEKA